MNKLVIDQLSFERNDIQIFEDLSAQWCSGDIVQIIGQNGAGKSTLMKLIVGVLQATRGSILWNDHAVNSYEFKSCLNYLGHLPGVKSTLTPLENLRWHLGIHGSKAANDVIVADEQLKSALFKVGLDAYIDVPAYQLSAGQQRRVALARLYLSKAPLWVLDEPFTAIDKKGVSDLEDVIDSHASSGGIVLLTTHQAWKSQSAKCLDIEAFAPKTRALHD